MLRTGQTMTRQKALRGILLMLMAACGTTASTLTPEATSDSGDNTVPLSYTSENGTQTVSYPRGWVIEEQAGLIALANNDATMRSVVAQGSLESGQAGLIITPFSAATIALMGESGNAPTTAAEFVSNLAARVASGTPSEAVEITVNGKSAA